MKKVSHIIWLLSLALLLSACLGSSDTGTPQAPVTDTPTGPRAVTILYTDDEHGWMAGVEEGQGAGNLAGLWQTTEFDRNANVLILSGGDNWTGPAISTWFDGQGMVEVMNAMGYTASVIGNHEFDFGLPTMQTRMQEAQFPYLSANMRYKENGAVPEDLGISPYTLVQANGIQFAILGLTSTSTPQTTNPANVADFDFIDYEEALRDFAPQAKAAGAQVLLVAAHACPDEMIQLASRVTDLQIPFFGAGHCHNAMSRKVGDSVVATSGANLRGYAFVDMEIDAQTFAVTIADFGNRSNQGGTADPEIAGIVAQWQELTDAELSKEIGYLEKEIPQRSEAMQALITEAWLFGYPNADVALTNLGGMRDRLPAGVLTVAEVVGVMPFNNVLVEVRLSGLHLTQLLNSRADSLAIGGLRRLSGNWILKKTGKPIDKSSEYSVLVNDFMYAGGDGLDILALADPEAYDTAIDWRQPVIDWIMAQESSPEAPLDPAIAALME